MAFDPDFDLTKDFNDIVTGNKKKRKVVDEQTGKVQETEREKEDGV